MNYSESQQVLEKVKNAKNIIVNCHYSPDPDSVGAALSMYQALKKLNKSVTIYSPGEIANNLAFLPAFKKVDVVEFSKVDYTQYDLFIALDSSTWDNIVGNKEFLQPNIDMVVVDHHRSNLGYGSVNLIDKDCVSTCEILKLMFDDWGLRIDVDLANTLLTGIIGDSGAFRYPATTHKTLTIASELMEIGADKDKIIFNLFQCTDYEVLKFWGLALSKLKIEDNFAWTAISNEEYKQFKKPLKAKSSFASVFLQSIDNTDFGFIAVEENKNMLDISFRSRTGIVDTSKIAVEMGGGGHIWAAGGRIEGLPFDKAVDKALQIIKKYSK